MKISLCLIVGNEEQRIERCLRSFAPLADEICVVRAVGAARPDATLEIAASRFGAKTAEYKNAPEHADWPHVDDFAAARNLSFSLASGDYIFWADADDILVSGAARARQLAAQNSWGCFLFPYEIHGEGLCLNRERMMLRGSGRWVCPVHEYFEFRVPHAAGFLDQGVVVRHLGVHEPHGSRQRNLRILEAIDPAGMSTGLLYHYVCELIVAGRLDDAVRQAELLLARPDLAAPEKVETFINLAAATKERHLRLSLLLQAHGADPARREPLAMLVNEAMNAGDGRSALAWARQMLALPVPATPAWNHRQAIYTWLGDDLHAQALRVAGRPDLAEQAHQRAVAKHGHPRIALLHATRGRAELAAATRKRWLDAAERPELVEHIFGCDQDDEATATLRRFRMVTCPPKGSVWAWNMAALACQADVLVQLSDDFSPFYAWDSAILERLGDPGRPAALLVSDGVRTDGLPTMAICTRAYFNQDYFLLHPGFHSVFSDNWFGELARRRGQLIDGRDLVFKHHHPLAEAGRAWDATYAAQNAPEHYQRGAALLERLRAGRDWSFIPGWFDYWWFYESLAARLRPGDMFAEVGVWMGRSLCYLGQRLAQLRKEVQLLAVDHFKGEAGEPAHQSVVQAHGGSIRGAFEANLALCDLTDRVHILEGDSAAAAADLPDGSLAACFIDAAHDFESVCRDILAWKSKVRPGGILAGHDAQVESVAQAVRKLLPGALMRGSVWAMTIKS